VDVDDVDDVDDVVGMEVKRVKRGEHRILIRMVLFLETNFWAG